MVLFHDHGSRYVGKMFNDDWMRDRGFLEVSIKTAADLVANQPQPLVTVKTEELVYHCNGSNESSQYFSAASRR